MPPPARVTLISPDDPESLALLRWVEAEDPALTTTTQRLPEAESLVLPPIQHRPSYASHQPKLKTLPPLTPDLSIPSSAATGPVRLPRVNANANAPGLARKTTANFADLPATLGDPVFADFKFRLTRPDAPANARFRVAIDGHAAIRVTLAALVTIYLLVFLAAVFLVWLSSEWNRRRRERKAFRFRLRCVICGFEFEDRTDALLPRCPRCGSLNERFKFERI